MTSLLEIQDLRVSFRTRAGAFDAVTGVDLSIPERGAVGLVGESGCGKSVTALSVLRLLPAGVARIVAGSIRLNGEELTTAPERRMREVRGGEVAMIFQDPMTSLNPVMTVGAQVAESIREHRGLKGAAAWQAAVKALDEVGIVNAAARARDYPHQFSGGMRQRAMIAMAIACEPRLLIADEPTTALDVTVQAEILALLDRLRTAHGMAVLLITHDLGVVAEFCQEVAVMYGGEIVERGPTRTLFDAPRHPYTLGLLGSTPDLDAPAGEGFRPIAGSPPRPEERPTGCPFHPRCPHRMEICASTDPGRTGSEEAFVRCHLYPAD